MRLDQLPCTMGGSTRALCSWGITGPACKWGSREWRRHQFTSAHLCVHYCSIRVCLQYKNWKIKVLRISRWQQQSIKPSMVPFWAQGPVWLHRTCEAGWLCYAVVIVLSIFPIVMHLTLSVWCTIHIWATLQCCTELVPTNTPDYESAGRAHAHWEKCRVHIYWGLIWHSVTAQQSDSKGLKIRAFVLLTEQHLLRLTCQPRYLS